MPKTAVIKLYNADYSSTGMTDWIEVGNKIVRIHHTRKKKYLNQLTDTNYYFRLPLPAGYRLSDRHLDGHEQILEGMIIDNTSMQYLIPHCYDDDYKFDILSVDWEI